jgi:hypothetical protein
MKVYVEWIDGKFYEWLSSSYSNEQIIDKIEKFPIYFSPNFSTENRDFEIGSYVYFQDVKWMEVISHSDCDTCIGEFTGGFCDKVLCADLKRKDKTSAIFKKLDINEKSKPEKQSDQFYVLNTKTNTTHYIHDSEQSSRTEAERLARLQPGDIFRILKVIGECTGKVDIKWRDK